MYKRQRNEQSREEWEIYWEIASRMGTPIELPGGPISLTERPTKFEILKRLTHAAPVPLETIRDQGRGSLFDEVQVIVTEPSSASDAKFQLLPPDIPHELKALASEPSRTNQGVIDQDQIYTHLLISRRLKHVFNSSGQQLEALRAKGTTNPAYMNPQDLESLSLSSGMMIEIESAAGALLGIVEAAGDVKPGVISMAHAWGDLPDNGGSVRSQGSSTNRLVDDDRTFNPITGMPRMSAIPVRIRAVEEALA